MNYRLAVMLMPLLVFTIITISRTSKSTQAKTVYTCIIILLLVVQTWVFFKHVYNK